MTLNVRCLVGRAEDGYPHDFDSFQSPVGGPPLLYCRRCGEVRELVLPSPDTATIPTTFTFDSHSPEPRA